MKDPYLIHRQVCKVWNNGKLLMPVFYLEFIGFDNDTPLWKESCFTESYFENYYPIGTEWDFAPEWAICSTVDKDGRILFWSEVPCLWVKKNTWVTDIEKCRIMEGGICPDFSRWKGKAWESSIREKPVWAGKEL